MPGRLYADGASPVIEAADLTLHANWGTTPAVTIATGSNDQRGSISINTNATVGANPTVIHTFKRAYAHAPFVIVCKGDADDTEEFAVTAVSATAFTVQLVGTPTQDVDYAFNYFVVG